MIRNTFKRSLKNPYNRDENLHILATNGRLAMKCWEWQKNKQFPHSNCNFAIRMDSSIDGKNIRQKFVESEIKWNVFRETAS